MAQRRSASPSSKWAYQNRESRPTAREKASRIRGNSLNAAGDRAGEDVRASAERVQPPRTVEAGKSAPGMSLPEPDRALRVELSEPWEDE